MTLTEAIQAKVAQGATYILTARDGYFASVYRQQGTHWQCCAIEYSVSGDEWIFVTDWYTVPCLPTLAWSI